MIVKNYSTEGYETRRQDNKSLSEKLILSLSPTYPTEPGFTKSIIKFGQVYKLYSRISDTTVKSPSNQSIQMVHRKLGIAKVVCHV